MKAACIHAVAFVLIIAAAAFAQDVPATSATQTAATGKVGFPFPAQDGMTMVFFGDSLMSSNRYTASIESYYQLHYPKWHVHFRNSSRGGEQLKGAIELFDPRVAIFRPTHVLFAYGSNGPPIIEEWGEQYVQLAKLVESIGAQPILVGEKPRYAVGQHPVVAARVKILREKIAPAHNWAWVDLSELFPYYKKNIESNNSIDMQWGMRGGKVDTGHPGPMGYVCMAYVILKNLGAPADVSSAELDAAAGKVLKETDCKITDISKTDNGITFTRMDERLPIAFDDDVRLSIQLVPEIADFNKYMLTVKGLAPGKYDVLIDGVPSATVDANTLAAGWNMFLMSAGPIHDQLLEVLKLIRNKEGLIPAQDPANAGNDTGPGQSGVKKVRDAAGWKFAKDGVKGKELVEQMKPAVDALLAQDEAINKAAQPKARKFEIIKAK